MFGSNEHVLTLPDRVRSKHSFTSGSTTGDKNKVGDNTGSGVPTCEVSNKFASL